jgi:hypothetical protein
VRCGATPSLKTRHDSEEQAYELILGGAGKLFDLAQEEDGLRGRYGRATFGQSCLMARRLVEKGVPYVTINYKGWERLGASNPGRRPGPPWLAPRGPRIFSTCLTPSRGEAVENKLGSDSDPRPQFQLRVQKRFRRFGCPHGHQNRHRFDDSVSTQLNRA